MAFNLNNVIKGYMDSARNKGIISSALIVGGGIVWSKVPYLYDEIYRSTASVAGPIMLAVGGVLGGLAIYDFNRGRNLQNNHNL